MYRARVKTNDVARSRLFQRETIIKKIMFNYFEKNEKSSKVTTREQDKYNDNKYNTSNNK